MEAAIAKSVFRSWMLAVMVAGAIVAAIMTTGAEARPLVTGISYAQESNPVQFEHVKDTGASLVQTRIVWDEVAPASEPASWNPRDPGDPHYEWDHVDAWVRNATAAGLTPLLQIYGGPKWAMGCKLDKRLPAAASAPCDPSPAKSADFAVAAAARYSGTFNGLPRVRFWQYQNEPNTFYFFQPQVDGAGEFVAPALYRSLINSVYDGIKSVDPTNVVLAAGLMPNSNAGFAPGPMNFARKMLCMDGRAKPRPTTGDCGGGVKFDVFDMHPYTSGGPTHNAIGSDNVHLGDLPELQRLLRAADRAGRIDGMYKRTPLWITEFSWDTKPPDPGGLPMKIHARWAAEAMYRSWVAGVSRFFWFSLVDQAKGDRPWSDTTQSGLYFRGARPRLDKPKRTFRAFRFPFVALTNSQGMRIWGRTPESSKGPVSIQVKTKNGWRQVAVVKARANGVFNRFLYIRYGRDQKGSVRAVYRKQSSVPFGMKYVYDFPVAPFG